MSTDNALPAERLKAFLLIARGMANFTSGIDLKNYRKIDQRCGTLWHAQFLPLLGGGLEPHFRVLFSAIFHGVSLGNFHQGRNLWKVAEAKVWSFLVSARTFFMCVLIIFRAVKIPVERVFDPGHGYLRRVCARVALGSGKRCEYD